MAEPFIDFRAALVTACNAAAIGGPLDGVTIVDGPVTTRTSDTRKLFIGTSGDGLSAEGDNEEGNLPGVVDSESFALICVAEAQGDILTNLRTSAFAIRAGVRAVLRPAPDTRTLGVPSIASARLGAWSLEESQPQTGPYVGITFRIEVIVRPGTY